MAGIAVLDWIFIGLLLLSMLVGAWRGLVYEVLSLGSWVLAFFVAQHFAPQLAPRLPLGDASELVRYAAAFVALFAASVFVTSLLVWLVSKLFAAVGLRPADRALGAVFGALRGLVLVLVVAVLVTMSPLRRERWWTESVGADWATVAVERLRPHLPSEWRRYLPDTEGSRSARGGHPIHPRSGLRVQVFDLDGSQLCAESWVSSVTHRSTS